MLVSCSLASHSSLPFVDQGRRCRLTEHHAFSSSRCERGCISCPFLSHTAFEVTQGDRRATLFQVISVPSACPFTLSLLHLLLVLVFALLLLLPFPRLTFFCLPVVQSDTDLDSHSVRPLFSLRVSVCYTPDILLLHPHLCRPLRRLRRST